jgi:asparagine synthase (glutamine-hydrolysing)
MQSTPVAPRVVVRGWIDLAPSAIRSNTLTIPAPEGMRFVSRPGLEVAVVPGKASVHDDGTIVCVCVGAPRFGSTELARLAERETPAAACRRLHALHGLEFAKHLRGSFAIAVADTDTRTALLAVDRYSIKTICFHFDGNRIVFADRADGVLVDRTPEIDVQALYEYLYFHVIPAPRTAFKGVERLRAGHTVEFMHGRTRYIRHWTPNFGEHEKKPFEAMKHEFRELIEAAVKREAGGRRVGCFLSGGTDSSTVAGMLSRVSGPAPTFSIGFDAEGYDEMVYARIAARHFGNQHHERYVSREDLVTGIPIVATWFDQPFGNSSAVPAYYCASVAHETGVEKLLAGDGGDELFGGNSRYATQRLLEAYQAIPEILRRRLIEPTLLSDALPQHIPLLRKAIGYVRQARSPMPERLDAYNLLLRLGTASVLAPQLSQAIDTAAPRTIQQAVWEETNGDAFINRMLVYDWKYTLADNDLRKVCETTELAAVDVAFPLLTDELVDFSLRLAPDLKLKGLRLRYFFKEALRDFLPDQIINKKKHGFGLPFGVWLSSHAGLKELARDALNTIKDRGIVRADFVDELWSTRLAEHPAYYGEMVWLLVILETWLRAHAPAFSLR